MGTHAASGSGLSSAYAMLSALIYSGFENSKSTTEGHRTASQASPSFKKKNVFYFFLVSWKIGGGCVGDAEKLV